MEGIYKHLIEILKRQEKRREIGVPINCKLLISVGELSVRKNHRVIVETLQSLPDDYWYVIVGKGDLKDELEKIDHTGRLKLLGFRMDIKELLWCSALFVFPSLQEGLPVALMEAMAAGVPVAASDIRGNVDLVKEGFNPASPENVREMIELTLSEGCTTTLASTFDSNNVGVAMMNIYKEGVLYKWLYSITK